MYRVPSATHQIFVRYFLCLSEKILSNNRPDPLCLNEIYEIQEIMMQAQYVKYMQVNS